MIEALDSDGETAQYKLPGKPLPYTLHSQFRSKAQHDMHGDVVREGGVLMGRFVRITPSGKGKWRDAAMSDVTKLTKQNEGE